MIGMVGSAQAVNLNPDGLGQVLIYPYYTVRANADGNAFNSLISVVNTTDKAKAVKVRFLEGKASQEVLDFNLYLSPEDVWVAAVTPTAEGAKITTPDTSCTAPMIPAGGEEFRLWQYQGDLEDQTLDRTREGYVEIIEMADIVNPSPTFTAVKHATYDGVWRPGNCAAVQDDGSTPAWVNTDLTTGTGKLFGSMTLVNVNEAQDVAFEATALDAFNNSGHLWAASGSIFPNLSEVDPAVAVVVNGKNVYITDWTPNPVDAVSAVLMNQTVYNEYVLHTETASKTDWVVTFPTKSYYYDLDQITGIRYVDRLFQRNFIKGGACDDLSIARFDREERRPTQSGDFSPRPPTGTNSLCWEANVVTFGASGTASLLNAQNRVTLPMPYDSGWAKFTFTPPTAPATFHTLTANTANTKLDLSGSTPVVTNPTSVVFSGLPMIGFAAQEFNNGTVQVGGNNVWSKYTGRIAHRFSKLITP
ncbi:MAG: hypothetical protein LBE75_03835 [Burkholderiales bacterium]|nr:hypothetical protein [Burkholderiales bacterium]